MLNLWTIEEVPLQTPCLISSHVSLLFLKNMVTLIRKQGVQVVRIENTGLTCQELPFQLRHMNVSDICQIMMYPSSLL